MSAPEPFDYLHFLEARREIDLRSTDLRLWRALIERLRGTGSLRIVEVGSGPGILAERLLGALDAQEIVYTLVDEIAAHHRGAVVRLDRALEARDFRLMDRSRERLLFEGPDGARTLEFVTADALSWLRERRRDGFRADLVVAQAVLDLFDVPSALEALTSVLRPGGSFYFPTIYDGLTVFLPQTDEAFDEEVSRFYDWTMDERARGAGRRGGSRSGRLALETLAGGDFAELDAAASDWIVLPPEGGYPEKVRYFLHQMVTFVENEGALHPRRIDPDRLRDWVRERRTQIEAGSMLLLARNLDVLGTV